MSEPVTQKLPLRHPAEIPMFIFMVVLNFVILAVLIDFLVSVALIPTELRGTNWEPTIRAVGRDTAGGSGDPAGPPSSASIDPRNGRAVVPHSVPGPVHLHG